MRFAAAALLAILVLAGCSNGPAPTHAGTLRANEVWVPIADWRLPGGQELLCAGGGLVGDYPLHGSLLDPRVVWMTDPHGNRVELGWPPGYRARFTPGLELLDGSGNVVGREGTFAIGHCQTADPNVMSVDLAAVDP